MPGDDFSDMELSTAPIVIDPDMSLRSVSFVRNKRATLRLRLNDVSRVAVAHKDAQRC